MYYYYYYYYALSTLDLMLPASSHHSFSICRIHCIFFVNSSTNSQFNIHSGDRWRLYVLLWLLVLLLLLLLLLLLFSVVVVVATEWNAIVAQYCHALTVVIAVVLAMMMMTIICWMAGLTTGIYLEGMMMMMEWMIEMLLIMSRLRHMLSYFAYPVGNCTCHTHKLEDDVASSNDCLQNVQPNPLIGEKTSFFLRPEYKSKRCLSRN